MQRRDETLIKNPLLWDTDFDDFPPFVIQLGFCKTDQDAFERPKAMDSVQYPLVSENLNDSLSC